MAEKFVLASPDQDQQFYPRSGLLPTSPCVTAQDETLRVVEALFTRSKNSVNGAYARA